MFCNIRARYIFDSMFYEERKKGTVPKERLNEIMVEAQKQAFGDILSDGGYHPLFWASKLHFSETGVPFYNYPYTFGHLFAGAIYSRARHEGPAFAEKYKALLIDTGSMACEEVAAKGFMIVIQDFQDPYTLDVKKLQKCCVSEITPDGRLIPFCAFNSVGYREQIREQLSTQGSPA